MKYQLQLAQWRKYNMTNWMWAKPGKYRIKKQKTLEDFEHE